MTIKQLTAKQCRLIEERFIVEVDRDTKNVRSLLDDLGWEPMPLCMIEFVERCQK